MTIYYLYVKTHNITGLKYLGFTSSKDPHKYIGSGTYWKLHLKKHGTDYTTTILQETTSKTTISELGTHYSSLWNITESDEWANLKPETGEGGFFLTEESHKKRVNTRIKKYGTANTNTPESISKALETRKKNGTLNVQTPEVVAKTIATKQKNGTTNTVTAESVAKGIETKRKNGTLGKNNITPESIAKQLETKRIRGTLSVPKKKVECPHCNLVGGSSQMKRWHFDNCRLKRV